MLKIHKLHSKKLSIISITSILSICTLLGISYLTYTPNLSHAETVTYPEKETRTIADITYMQEITPEICANTKEADTNGNNQYRLIDKRDSKTYWVAKLKNGNCWMTQNLDYDLKTTISLTNTDSDVRDNWIPTVNTQTSETPNFIQDNNAPNIVQSWDPAQGGAATYCTNYGISGSCKTSGNSTTSMNNGHDAQGNYYSWMAVTAGSGDASITEAGVNAPDSICPKGWKLPMKEFYTLFDGMTENEVFSAPYYLVYGGNVYGSSISDRYAVYWSSTSDGKNIAYAIHIYNHGVPTGIISNQISGVLRYNGSPIRCIAHAESIPNNNVEITVNSTISLDVTNEVEVKKSEANPSTAAFSALVASNQPYSVSISSANPALTSSTSSTTISSKSGLLNTNDNAWGIKKLDTTKAPASSFTAITSANQTFYTSSAPESTILLFPIGISTNPDLPSGEYSTNITVTATQNQLLNIS